MSDSTRKTANAFYEALTSLNVDAAAALLSADSIEHTPPPIPDFQNGPEGFKKLFAVYTAAFPDLKLTVEKVAVEGDWFFGYGTWTGTHKGSMMGEEPTGKTVTGQFIEMSRVKDGKLVEHRSFGDDMQVMGALGMAPPA